jgi:hypothetical protein
MSFNVRLTGYRGLLQTKVWNPRQDGETSVYLLCQPYEFSQVVTSNGLAPVAIGPSGITAWQDYTFFVRVEVPPFQQIYYEIQTPNRSVTPSLNSSPTAVGVSLLKWGAGWFLSFIETGISIPAAELVSETGPFLTSESGNILVVP